jgi:hypothetical protein
MEEEEIEKKIKKKKIRKLSFREYNINKKKQTIQHNRVQSNEILNKFKYDPPIPKRSRNKTNIIFPSLTEKKTNETEKKINPNIKKKKKYYVKFIKVNTQKFEDEILSLNSKKKKDIDELNDRITFNQYIQLQNKVEAKLKPIRGDLSNEFMDYMNKLNEIRNIVMEKEIDKILNTENRYNEEYPEDTQINLIDKGLNDYKWKNMYNLSEYQNFFLDEIKGKISSVNYREMLKKFRQISKICFAEGKMNFASITKGLSEY